MRFTIAILILALMATPATAQVAIAPSTTEPASWERFSLRIINQTDTPTVSVQLEVPAAISVLGVDPRAGWAFETAVTPDSGPTVITWRGGQVRRGEFGEFVFLGRLKADARQEELVFPVKIERANGSVVEWRNRRGEDYAAPRVEVAGTVRVSAAGQILLAGLALGVAIVALVVAIAGRVPRRTA
ncbi:MAG: DUF1775 domain-containing protein [Gemmatimonadetes bacterium]|nr:DUF1775 domain-containing protein [Gemmatimonadota bacterium]